jgi:RNA polymerase sigma factor (sigma-70 family)
MWRQTLAAGDSARAWDQFIARYGRLIHSVIRRTLADDEDADDVFSEVCADLCADDLRLPATHVDSGRASFATWLVTVVRHRAIDWVRRRDGRQRVKAPQGLSTLQQQIFNLILVEHRSHVEAYEIIRQRGTFTLSFAAFMREVSSTFTDLEHSTGKTITRYFPGPPPAIEQAAVEASDAVVISETASSIRAALDTLPPDERMAIQLFVVEELPAAAVARAVGWPNAKSVYNRVYRALETLRQELGTREIESGPDD